MLVAGFNFYLNNLNQIIMKKYILFLIPILLFSCRDANVKSNFTEFYIGANGANIQIIEVDSCEYLYGDWGYATVLTHKGNCKFCKKRK